MPAVTTTRSRLRQLGGAAASGRGLVAQLAERAHLTMTGVAMLVFVAAGWWLAHALTSEAMMLMVFGGVGAVAMAWLVARRRLALALERSKLPLRIRVGQSVDVELVVTTRRHVSTVLLQEELPARLGTTVQVPVASLSPSGELRHSYSFRPSLRGVYEVGPCTATWSDPFGITVQSQVVAEPVKLIVHPPTELVHDRIVTRMWEDPPIRPPVSKPWPMGFEFYGMRDYVPGDDVRRIVWNAVAKTGRLLVRESEQGITDRIVIIVDSERASHSPGDPSETFETAIRVAASVGVRHLSDGMAVTLASGSGTVLESARGERARITYLDELARMELNDTRLDETVAPLLRSARGSHFVVITPHLTGEGALRLKLLLDRGASIVIAKLLWDESDPMSMQRAGALGCRLVQVPVSAPLEAVFATPVGVGVK